jgi:hypothetical protein
MKCQGTKCYIFIPLYEDSYAATKLQVTPFVLIDCQLIFYIEYTTSSIITYDSPSQTEELLLSSMQVSSQQNMVLILFV